MEFRELIQRAMQIREQYAELETGRYDRVWTDEEIAMGFMGDVGDLAKLILAREGVRTIPDADANLHMNWLTVVGDRPGRTLRYQPGTSLHGDNGRS